MEAKSQNNNSKYFIESLTEKIFLISASVAVISLLLIIGFVFYKGLRPFIIEGYSFWDFIFGTQWIPSANKYGILPMIVASLGATIGALLIGVPVGILTSIFIAENMQGFGSIGAFSRLAGTLTRRFHSTRSLGAALVLMCFFLAMLVTNDVSLLTLVPLTIALFRSMPEVCIRTVVLGARCGKPGSMATPMGNPQNLYIYSHFSMPVADFFRVTLPPTALSLALLLLSVLIIPAVSCPRLKALKTPRTYRRAPPETARSSGRRCFPLRRRSCAY